MCCRKYLLPIEGIEPLTDFVPYSTEPVKDKTLVPNKLRRVIKTDVQAVGNLSGEIGATSVRSSTYGDHIIPRLMEIVPYIAGSMPGNIYPYLRHHLHGKRIDACCW